MLKDFDSWNLIKKRIDLENRVPIRVGEIFWCKLGLNIGVEQNGNEKEFTRPVIIIKKFSNQIVLIAPLTTKPHKGNWYLEKDILGIKQQIILNQIKPVDVKRLTKSLGEISEKEVQLILYEYFKLLIL